MQDAEPITKRFSLRTVLSVTCRQLLAKPTEDGGGRKAQIYEILRWMTNEDPTNQGGRFMKECGPWLLLWFLELGPASGKASLANLYHWQCPNMDDWECVTRGERWEWGIQNWLVELRNMVPALKDEYDVPRIPASDPQLREPMGELIEMRQHARSRTNA